MSQQTADATITQDCVLRVVASANGYGIRPNAETSVAGKILQRAGTAWSKFPDAIDRIEECIQELTATGQIRRLNNDGAIAVVESRCSSHVSSHRRRIPSASGRCGASRANAE